MWSSAPVARPVELARLVVEMVAERIEALLAGAGARLVGEAPAGGGLLAQLLGRLRAPLAHAACLGGIIEWHSGGPFESVGKFGPRSLDDELGSRFEFIIILTLP